MLPNPTFKWKQQPVLHVWRKNSDNGEVLLTEYDATNCTSLFEEALCNNEVPISDAYNRSEAMVLCIAYIVLYYGSYLCLQSSNC